MPRNRTKRKKRSVKKRVLILCEGTCEVNYFNGIKVDEDYRRGFTGVNVKIYQPTNYSPLGLVNEAIVNKEKAIKEKNPFDSVWVCFDKDGHANIHNAFRLAHTNKVNVIFSKICFEYWVLLHFEDTTQSFRRSEFIIRHIKNNHDRNYHKTKNNFKILKDNTKIAIRRAKRVRNNIPQGENKLTVDAYTDVDKLVEYLFKL